MHRCPYHPAGQLCHHCDPAPAVRRTLMRRSGIRPKVNWFSGWRLLVSVPALLFGAYVAAGFGVVLVILFPLLPLLVWLIFGGAVWEKARARRTKAAIDYAAVRIAEEIAHRR